MEAEPAAAGDDDEEEKDEVRGGERWRGGG